MPPTSETFLISFKIVLVYDDDDDDDHYHINLKKKEVQKQRWLVMNSQSKDGKMNRDGLKIQF